MIAGAGRLGLVMFAAAWLSSIVAASQPVRAEDGVAQEVRATIEAQIDAFRRDDAAGAYGYAAPSVKAAFPTPEAFLAMVKRGYRPVYRPKSVTFGRFSERNGIYLQEVSLVGPDGQFYMALYSLERGEAGLVITGCVLRQTPGQTL